MIECLEILPHTRRERQEEIVSGMQGNFDMIKWIEIMLDVQSREMWRKRLLGVIKGEKNWRPKVESECDPRRKINCAFRGPWSWKNIETEMIRCCELSMYQSCENRNIEKGRGFHRRKKLTRSPMCICKFSYHRFSPSLHYFVHFVIKWKEKKQIIFLYTRIILLFARHTTPLYFLIPQRSNIYFVVHEFI